MPEALADKPVFIDQTPDYQQAIGQIAVLSQDKDRFRAVVQELGMGAQLARLDALGSALKGRAGGLLEAQRGLDERSAEINAKAANAARMETFVGQTAMLSAGAVAGIVGSRKRWGIIKTVLTAGAASAATGVLWLFGGRAYLNRPSPETTALAQDSAALDFQKQQLVEEQIALGTQFTADMATRMLEQRKMLVGQGADMHLESTKDATPAVSMAAKYAAPPAASKAEALQATVSAEMQR